MANTKGPVSLAAYSMLTRALVTSRFFASSATFGSAIKHTAWPPSVSRARLLMPDAAIFVSVTMVNPPFLKISRAFSTA